MVTHDEEDDVTQLRQEVEELRSRSLTTKQMEDIRSLLEQDARVKWLWSTARSWALAVAALVAGFTMGVDTLKAAVRRLVE
jgi:hypothetical protein